MVKREYRNLCCFRTVPPFNSVRFCTCGWPQFDIGHFLLSLSTISFKMRLSVNLERGVEASQSATEPHNPPVFPPSTGIARVCCHVPCFLCRSGGSKLRSLRLYWTDGLTYAPFSLAQLSVFFGLVLSSCLSLLYILGVLTFSFYSVLHFYCNFIKFSMFCLGLVYLPWLALVTVHMGCIFHAFLYSLFVLWIYSECFVGII